MDESGAIFNYYAANMAHKNPSNRSPMKPRRTGMKGRHQRPQQVYSFHEADDRLYDLFRNHGFAELEHSIRHQFVNFYQMLMEAQEHNNFTRLLTLKDIGIKHFIDCMMVPRLTELHFPLLDLGTGPGFPGIPLKILFPEERILLAEGVQKRVEFLKHVREKMDLKNLDIIGRNINPDFHLPVQSVITRAVEDIGNTLRNVVNSLQVGGRVIFMKGPRVGPEIEEADTLWRDYYRRIDDINYQLPETPHQRRLVLYEKTAHPDEEWLAELHRRLGIATEDSNEW